ACPWLPSAAPSALVDPFSNHSSLIIHHLSFITYHSSLVSDEGCGALHTKPGDEDCVLKCLRGGAHVGHPEWKAQRMVFVTDEGHKIWVVVNPKALTGFEGKHVTITGHLQAASKKIRVTIASEVKTT
ncbi:MAG: hypothetical protein M3Q91_03565, partial [Acidobacteriota bacterium]|nr:hypothetical protein [Acidobacteriota bacterium]